MTRVDEVPWGTYMLLKVRRAIAKSEQNMSFKAYRRSTGEMGTTSKPTTTSDMQGRI